jgi:SAM-dependent methyltransferase
MAHDDFDQFAESYDTILTKQLQFFEDDNHYFSEYKVQALRKMIRDEPKHILDFGCGIGRSSSLLQHYFPNASVYGCDSSKKSLVLAKQHHPTVEFFATDALPTKVGQFDVIFISNVLHHIPPEERLNIIELLASASAKGAHIVVFEHNPYNPVTRYLVNTCPFDHDAVLLKPKEVFALFSHIGVRHIHSRYTLFFPSVLKKLRSLEPYLGLVPLGGQYFVHGQL